MDEDVMCVCMHVCVSARMCVWISEVKKNDHVLAHAKDADICKFSTPK